MLGAAWAAFKVSRVAQIAVAVGLAFVGYTSWLARRDRNIRDREQRRIINDIRKQTDETRERVRAAENRITNDLNAGELRRLAGESPDNRGRVQLGD
ncbi:MAG: hypothetical protein AAGJ50_09405 [Pseudomonadota bacterium]